jgi:arylsulfatase A-like enzyme
MAITGRISLVALLALLGLVSARPAAHGAVGPGTKPNIIVILTDDQDYSAETISKMPYLASRTGWYRFDSAFVNNPTCCPSRATFLTGEWSHHTGVEYTRSAARFDDSDTVATRLDAAGYRTGWFGKYHLGPAAPQTASYIPPGWDAFVDHKAQSPAYYDYTLNDNGALVDYGSAPADYATDVLASKTLSFVDQAVTDGVPFFAVFAPRAPHNKWTPAPRHIDAYADEPVSFPPSWNEDTSDKPTWWASRPQARPGNRANAMRDEWEALLAVDEAIRSLDRMIQNRGRMNKTIIVFTTDNGYSFGEHRWGRKRCVYDSCSKVPLYVKYGGHNEGTVFDAIVGNEDYAATFAELAGVSPPFGSDGQSMASMLKHRTTPPEWQSEELLRSYNAAGDLGNPPDAWGLRTPEYLYAEMTATGDVELYDLTVDPYQLENRADNPLYLSERLELERRLGRLRNRP